MVYQLILPMSLIETWLFRFDTRSIRKLVVVYGMDSGRLSLVIFYFFLVYIFPLTLCEILAFVDLIVKILAEHMADAKENLDGNLLMSSHVCNMVMLK